MDEKLIEKIDSLIEEYTERLVADTIKLVNIKSTEDTPAPGAPFGKGPREVLDTFMNMAADAGLYTEDYGVGVVSAAMKEGAPDLGIWMHGDVVPEGEGWSFPPYSATEYKDCIIGRGATDNKGQISAIFNLFRIFRELGIELKYNPAIYIGSNEETGMADIVGTVGNPDAKGFINVCTPPRMSLVPDGSFPVGYGGKGGMNIALISKRRLRGLDIIAGTKTAPGLATAIFKRKTALPSEIPECEVIKEEGKITAYTPPRHTSNPDPNGNMITKLSHGLLKTDLLTKKERRALEFFNTLSLDINGKELGIFTEYENMKPLTVFAKSIYMMGTRPEISLNIRYPMGITYEEIVTRITAYAKKRGFKLSWSKGGVRPYVLDAENEVVRALCEVSNEVTGENKGPYTLGGGTYAHRLPNAYVFGTDSNLPPEDFPKGRGGAHGIDEAVSVLRLKRTMKIYARALLRLNEMEW